MSILKNKAFFGLLTVSVAAFIAACSQTVVPPESDDAESEAIEKADDEKSDEKVDEKADEKTDEKSEEATKDDDSSKDDSSKDDSSSDDEASKDDSSDSESSDSDESAESSDSASEGDDAEATEGDNAPESSASSESGSDTPVKGEETSITEGDNGNTNVNVGTNDMEEVSKEESDKLDDLLKGDELPEGTEKIEGGVNGGDIDPSQNDYYCYTGEGWLKINFDNLKESGLPFLWNGAAWGLRKKYDMFFDDACEAVYAIRK